MARASTDQKGAKQETGKWAITTADEFIDEPRKSNKRDSGAFEASANNLASAAASPTSPAPPQLRDLPVHVRLEPCPPPQRRAQTWEWGPPQPDATMPLPPAKKVRSIVDERASAAAVRPLILRTAREVAASEQQRRQSFPMRGEDYIFYRALKAGAFWYTVTLFLLPRKWGGGIMGRPGVPDDRVASACAQA